MTLRPKTFYFHYNKPSSQRTGKTQVSVHFNNTCHIVDNVICEVPTTGKISKRQPRFVMKGKAKKLTIKNKIAYLK
jgi:hypothetical protein